MHVHVCSILSACAQCASAHVLLRRILPHSMSGRVLHVCLVVLHMLRTRRGEYCTVSSDGTIRVWDLHTHLQRVQFQVPGEQVLCVAYNPRQAELACGFANGRLRVFDLETSALVQVRVFVVLPCITSILMVSHRRARL